MAIAIENLMLFLILHLIIIMIHLCKKGHRKKVLNDLTILSNFPNIEYIGNIISNFESRQSESYEKYTVDS